MKKILTLGLLVMLLSNCTTGQNQEAKTSFTATEFAQKIKEMPTSVILDVRTPGEFSRGHLPDAVNYDWNGSGFDRQVSHLDKSKPVFVYCQSGSRSANAAQKMRSDGFSQVYELRGGIMKWRAANLPETTGGETASRGMSRQQFNDLLRSDKLVLVDFYADWCAPCKKMKPYLDEISKDLSDKVVVVRINADEHKTLCKELSIDALPVLQLYKNNKLTWSNTGFIEKAEVLKKLQ